MGDEAVARRGKVKTMTLKDLPVGEWGQVRSVTGNSVISKRLMEMGVVPGVSIRRVKSAPFGDPIEVRLLGYNLAIRGNEAEAVEIERA